MQKEYKTRTPLAKEDRSKFEHFSDTLAQLLFHRGFTNQEEITAFLSPEFEKNHDSFLLEDMEKAVGRIIDAVKKEERVCVFSDYDADGIPGGALLHDFFGLIGFKNFFNYIPDRQEEGFGLNKDALEKIKKEGATLLITVDCGISDLKEIIFAKEIGIDVIVTDHHLPSSEGLPNAFAIINPKVSPEYPEQMLCGTGVAFKLIQAILKTERFGVKEGAEKWLLDLVGIATLSDMVPLVGENRIFAHFGLLVLRKTRRIGLQKLFKKLKLNQGKLSEDDVGFMVAPRINAASRMGISLDAFKLLTTSDEVEAEALVKRLEEANNERKGTTAYLAKEVKKIIEAKYSPYFSNKVIVAGSPSWKPSILGLVAGSIAEKENKPVFLWGKEGSKEELKGSCRGVAGTSVTDIMSSVSNGVLSAFGGHHLAGGFSVSYESVHLLDDEIERAFEKAGTVLKNHEVMIDFVFNADEVTDRLLREIECLMPFGIGNEKPLILVKNAKVTDIGFFGKEKNHLKVLLQRTGRPLEAIAFFVNQELVKKVEKNSFVSVVGSIERNFFGGNSVRIRISDFI